MPHSYMYVICRFISRAFIGSQTPVRQAPAAGDGDKYYWLRSPGGAPLAHNSGPTPCFINLKSRPRPEIIFRYLWFIYSSLEKSSYLTGFPEPLQNMLSKSRAKSCNRCRVAKTRCSMSAPCSRCTKRNLECYYVPVLPQRPNDRRPRELRPVQPIAIATSTFEGAKITDDAHGDQNRAVTAMQNSLSNITDKTALVDIAGPIMSETGSQASDMTIYSDFMPQLFDMHIASDVPLPGMALSDKSGDVLAYPYFIDPWTPSLTSFPGLTMSLRPNLSPRERSINQGSLTAKLLFSQLVDYARMMADGKRLPPFIHPPCSLGHNYECPLDAPHHCLPETLAICTNLTQMFYARTPGSYSFVWQQISAHLHQMRAMVSSASNFIQITRNADTSISVIPMMNKVSYKHYKHLLCTVFYSHSARNQSQLPMPHGWCQRQRSVSIPPDVLYSH